MRIEKEEGEEEGVVVGKGFGIEEENKLQRWAKNLGLKKKKSCKKIVWDLG